MDLRALLWWLVSFAVGESIWETVVRLSGLLGALFVILLFLVGTPNDAHHVASLALLLTSSCLCF